MTYYHKKKFTGKNRFRKVVLLLMLVMSSFSRISYAKTKQKKKAEDIFEDATRNQKKGDPVAKEFYLKAIKADNKEPKYNLHYADYLRNFRGPQKPLFNEAEESYYKALEKIDKALIEAKNDKNKIKKLQNLKKRVVRSLAALYERDGFPVLRLGKYNKPFLFISTQDTYTLLSEEIRDLSSEALFASSTKRLNKDSWKKKDLRKFIRVRPQFDTFNRLRIRIGQSQWIPWIDGIYQYTDIRESQITNFFVPDKFNDVKVNSFGGALEWACDFYPAFDMSLRGEYRKIARKGLIEFLPKKTEYADSYTGDAVLSRFIGSDKLNLELTYAFEDIDQDISNPIKRERKIMAGTLRYQFFDQESQKRLFDLRNWELFLGAKSDIETWAGVDAEKNDYFAGLALKGLGEENRFDITLQPTIFTYNNTDDNSLDNAQYRSNITLLYRIIDNENISEFEDKPFNLSFVNIVLPMSYDVAIDGINDFENFKIGLELDTKIIGLALRNTTFLASARYDYQQFYNLDKEVNLFSINISMGF